MIRALKSASLGRALFPAVALVIGSLPLMSATQSLAVSSAPNVTGLSSGGDSVCGGSNLVITGTNFTGATEVDFGTSHITTGYEISSDGTMISVDHAPPHDTGKIDVQVTTPNGTSDAVADEPVDEFTYVSAHPSVSSITPDKTGSSNATPATAIIVGSCFVDNANTPAGSIVFSASTGSGSPATRTVGSVDSAGHFTAGNSTTSGFPGPNAVQLAPPADPTSGFQQSASVTVNGSSSAANYYYVSAPTVVSIAPTSGSEAGGTVVAITGNDFTGGTPGCDIIDVTFGTGNHAVVGPTTCTDDMHATVTSPAVTSPGAFAVVVTTDGGSSSATPTPANTFTYNTPGTAPTLSDMSIHAGKTGGGDTDTLTGTGYATGATCNVTEVLFGTVAYTEPTTGWTGSNACASTSFTVAGTPAQTCGSVDVRVVTTSGESALSAGDDFDYLPIGAPCVSAVAPARGPVAGGTMVTITGMGFLSSDTATFGSNGATANHYVSGTQLTATSPASTLMQAGPVDVTVRGSVANPGDTFTYVAAPSVSSVSPTQGKGSGGDSVTVNGSGFQGGLGSGCNVQSVDFQGAPNGGHATLPNPLTCTDGSIVVTSPPDWAGGAVNVVVTTDGGPSSTTTIPPNADQYTYVAAPKVTAVSPASGSLMGTTSVTVTGAGFFSDKGACDIASVKFGTVAGTSPACASDTSLTVTAPAGAAAGPVEVVVSTGDGGSSANNPADTTDTYTYIAIAGYIADAWGGVHSFGTAPDPSPITGYWPGWDIVRGIATRPNQSSGYTLDGWGGLHGFGGAPDPSPVSGYWPGWDITRGVVLDPCDGGAKSGYVLDGWGGLHPFGGAPDVTVSSYAAGMDIYNRIAMICGAGSVEEGVTLDHFGGVHPFVLNGKPMPTVTGNASWPGWNIARGVVITGISGGAFSGYSLDGWGGVHPYGTAPAVGATGYWPGWDITRGMVVLPGTNAGYVLDGWGGLHAYGGAPDTTVSGYWPGWDIVKGIS